MILGHLKVGCQLLLLWTKHSITTTTSWALSAQPRVRARIWCVHRLNTINQQATSCTHHQGIIHPLRWWWQIIRRNLYKDSYKAKKHKRAISQQTASRVVQRRRTSDSKIQKLPSFQRWWKTCFKNKKNWERGYLIRLTRFKALKIDLHRLAGSSSQQRKSLSEVAWIIRRWNPALRERIRSKSQVLPLK